MDQGTIRVFAMKGRGDNLVTHPFKELERHCFFMTVLIFRHLFTYELGEHWHFISA
jgi:hypothetical protein